MKKYIKSVMAGELNRIRTSFIGVVASAPSACTPSIIFTTRSRTYYFISFRCFTISSGSYILWTLVTTARILVPYLFFLPSDASYILF